MFPNMDYRRRTLSHRYRGKLARQYQTYCTHQGRLRSEGGSDDWCRRQTPTDTAFNSAFEVFSNHRPGPYNWTTDNNSFGRQALYQIGNSGTQIMGRLFQSSARRRIAVQSEIDKLATIDVSGSV